ncbi:MAG: Bax inhibitor-1/YccA family protein [Burkholderiaceae bacterium]
MADTKSYDFGRSSSATTVPVRNEVLRNTYWLLALSMLPTALGAYIGLQFNFNFFAGSPVIGFVAFLAIAFAFFWGIERTKNSGMGVVLLLGFTFFMGLMLSRILSVALGLENGASLIGVAALGTGGVFFGLASYASVTKRDFSNWGKFLFVGVIMLLVASVANIFLKLPALSLAISTMAVGVFSLYLLFDLKRIMDGGETNYITATLSVYLDIYNIFVNLLSLLMAFTGNNRD